MLLMILLVIAQMTAQLGINTPPPQSQLPTVLTELCVLSGV